MCQVHILDFVDSLLLDTLEDQESDRVRLLDFDLEAQPAGTVELVVEDPVELAEDPVELVEPEDRVGSVELVVEDRDPAELVAEQVPAEFVLGN